MNPLAPVWAGSMPPSDQVRQPSSSSSFTVANSTASNGLFNSSPSVQSTLSPHSAAFSPARTMPGGYAAAVYGHQHQPPGAGQQNRRAAPSPSQQQQQQLSPNAGGGVSSNSNARPAGGGFQRGYANISRGAEWHAHRGGIRGGHHHIDANAMKPHHHHQGWSVPASGALPTLQQLAPAEGGDYQQRSFGHQHPILHQQHHQQQQQHFTAYPQPAAGGANSPSLLSRPPPSTAPGGGGGPRGGKNASLSPDQDDMAFDALTKDIWTAAHTATSSPPKPTSAHEGRTDGTAPPPLHTLLLSDLAPPSHSHWGPAAARRDPADGDANVTMQELLAQLTMTEDEGRKSGSAPGAAAPAVLTSGGGADTPSWLDVTSAHEGERSPAASSAAAAISQRESESSHPRMRGDMWLRSDGKGDRPSSASGGRGSLKGPPSAIGSSPTSSTTSPNSTQCRVGGDAPDASKQAASSSPSASPKKPTKQEATASPLSSSAAVSQVKHEDNPAGPTTSAVAHNRTPSRVESLSSNPSSSIAVAPNASKIRWPPSNRSEAELFLRQHDAPETLRHIKILSFSRQFPDEVAKLFKQWADKGIPPPDDVFGAYYYYVAVHSKKELCMKHNGRGKVPGVGYGGCDFAARGTNYKCRFQHQCLFCKGEDHGWFDELKCKRYKTFRKELERMQIAAEDVDALVDAFDRK